MAKGSGFEREICRELSLWFSGGERDDLYWRTSTSGARATVRRRKGKSTAGGCGDICALDPIGQPFLDAFAVKVKRGYNRATIADLVDAPPRAAKQTWQKWIEQAEASREASSALWWMIIARRDQRRAVAAFPAAAMERLPVRAAQAPVDAPGILFTPDGDERGAVCLAPLSAFLANVSPGAIREAVGKGRMR